MANKKKSKQVEEPEIKKPALSVPKVKTRSEATTTVRFEMDYVDKLLADEAKRITDLTTEPVVEFESGHDGVWGVDVVFFEIKSTEI